MDYEAVAVDIAEIVAGLDLHAVAFDRWRMDIMQRENQKLAPPVPCPRHRGSYFGSLPC